MLRNPYWLKSPIFAVSVLSGAGSAAGAGAGAAAGGGVVCANALLETNVAAARSEARRGDRTFENMALPLCVDEWRGKNDFLPVSLSISCATAAIYSITMACDRF